MRIDGFWGNDQFDLLGLEKRGTRFGAGTDSGLTNYLGLRLEVGPVVINAVDNMITQYLAEDRWGEHLRVDEISVHSSYQFEKAFNRWVGVRLTAILGVEAVGDLGGLQVQDAVHHLPFIKARTIGDGLQTEYVGERKFGLIVGAAAGLDLKPVEGFTLSADANGTGMLGTGVNRATFRLGVELKVPENDTHLRPFVGASFTGTLQSINDERLALSGGYREGAFVSPALTAGVDVGPVRIAMELHKNRIGNEQGIGEVKLGFEF